MFMVVPLWSLSAEWFANLLYIPMTPIRRSIGVLMAIALGYALLRHGLQDDTQWIDWIGPIRGTEALEIGRAHV